MGAAELMEARVKQRDLRIQVDARMPGQRAARRRVPEMRDRCGVVEPKGGERSQYPGRERRAVVGRGRLEGRRLLFQARARHRPAQQAQDVDEDILLVLAQAAERRIGGENCGRLVDQRRVASGLDEEAHDLAAERRLVAIGRQAAPQRGGRVGGTRLDQQRHAVLDRGTLRVARLRGLGAELRRGVDAPPFHGAPGGEEPQLRLAGLRRDAAIGAQRLVDVAATRVEQRDGMRQPDVLGDQKRALAEQFFELALRHGRAERVHPVEEGEGLAFDAVAGIGLAAPRRGAGGTFSCPGRKMVGIGPGPLQIGIAADAFLERIEGRPEVGRIGDADPVADVGELGAQDVGAQLERVGMMRLRLQHLRQAVERLQRPAAARMDTRQRHARLAILGRELGDAQPEREGAFELGLAHQPARAHAQIAQALRSLRFRNGPGRGLVVRRVVRHRGGG